jgi:hypothetical protein
MTSPPPEHRPGVLRPTRGCAAATLPQAPLLLGAAVFENHGWHGSVGRQQAQPLVHLVYLTMAHFRLARPGW